MRDLRFPFFLGLFVFLICVNSAIAEDDVVEDESNVIIDVILPVALAFIMFSLGIGLTVDDFSIITKEPKVFAIGIANQMIVLPIVAFAIASGLGLSAELSANDFSLFSWRSNFQYSHKISKRRYSSFCVLYCSSQRGHRCYFTTNCWFLNGSLYG